MPALVPPRRRAGVALVAAPAISFLVASCQLAGPEGPIAQIACPELRGNAMAGRFTADARANANIRAFVQASADLDVVARGMEAQVAEACARMGLDLGLAPAQMAPLPGPGGRARGACGPMSARLDAALRSSGYRVAVSYAPPECRFGADAYASCAAGCDVQATPGSVQARCAPGHLSGSCEGTCHGGCDGTCSGACEGSCSQAGPNGQCAGSCGGTCHGSCSATCHAQCQGQWQSPRCDVDARAPSAQGKCDASCKAHAELTATCTSPRVSVQPGPTPELARLTWTLQNGLPALITAQVGYGKRLAADLDALAQVAASLGGSLGDVGLRATACIADAGARLAEATASIHATVSVSASVSGRVGVGG